MLSCSVSGWFLFLKVLKGRCRSQLCQRMEADRQQSNRCQWSHVNGSFSILFFFLHLLYQHITILIYCPNIADLPQRFDYLEKYTVVLISKITMVDHITKRKICQIYFAKSDKQRSDWVCKYFVSKYDKYAALIGLVVFHIKF